MKVVTFNVNGLRARLHQLEAVIQIHQPDIICLQETKVHDSQFPYEQVKNLGYHVTYHGQKSHYGVATLSKIEPDMITKGFFDEPDDHQRRLLITSYRLADGQRLQLLNGYFPQGENRAHPEKFPNKREFYRNLNQWLRSEADPQELLLVVGDFNVAPQDTDIGIGEDNRRRWLKQGKTCFLPEERQWFGELTQWGLKDVYEDYRLDDDFSWFDYRSRGFEAEPKRGLRIDMILATELLRTRCTGSGIDYSIRGMEKPSDHCPVWAEFAL